MFPLKDISEIYTGIKISQNYPDVTKTVPMLPFQMAVALQPLFQTVVGSYRHFEMAVLNSYPRWVLRHSQPSFRTMVWLCPFSKKS
jgi:hypothetical protein